jgi:predicted lipoprotein with Yx(FWY)xxD motif
MKRILFLFLLFAFSSFTASTDVYLCNSKGGKRYHFKKDCRGLSNCQAEIKKVTLDDAKKIGKTICGYED